MKRLSENARILVVKFNAIGDLVMTTPAIRDLREAYPKAHIALLVGSWSAPVMHNNPHLDEILEFDPQIFLQRRWIGLFRLLIDIRRRHFDCAVIFHAMPMIQLLMWLAGIPMRYGMTRNGRAMFLTKSVPEDFGAGNYYAIKYQEVSALAGARIGPSDPQIYTSASDELETKRILINEGLQVGEEFLLVAPGGARNPVTDMAAKRWPPESFLAVIQEILIDRSSLRVVLSGTESDREETGFLLERIPRAVDLTGKLTLQQLICATRSAKAVLCNDSSVLHIGVACRVPVVVPFGPTNARQLMPGWALPYAWQAGIACSPCYQVGGGKAFAGCPIGYQCMRETGRSEIRPLLESALAHVHNGKKVD